MFGDEAQLLPCFLLAGAQAADRLAEKALRAAQSALKM